MPLKFPDEEESERSIFPHNRDFGEGVRERGIREGQATIIVAFDGSGDAESVQEGIDMLPSTGGVVYVKEGTYNLNSSNKIIIANSNTSIIGAGKSTKITTTGNIIAIDTNTKSNIEIRTLYILGGGGDDNEGIWINNSNLCTIDSCWIETMGSNAIVIQGAGKEVKITNCWLKSNGRAGIEIEDGIKCIIIGNNLESNADGILGNSCDQSIITGNIIKSSTNKGISANLSSNNNIIIGNQIISVTDAINIAGNNNIAVGNQP